MIERITLARTLPAVFAGCEKDAPVCFSELWLHDVELARGHRYLIHAESGTGKSSLCSFIYGNRSDYHGHILFDGRDTRELNRADWCRRRCGCFRNLR